MEARAKLNAKYNVRYACMKIPLYVLCMRIRIREVYELHMVNIVMHVDREIRDFSGVLNFKLLE